MNYGMKKKSNKAFNSIISCKNTTIATIVKEPFFRSKLKSSNKTLIEYLNDDRTIDQICDWVLTEDYIKDKNYKPISQLIIRIFKEAPEKILTSFSMNERLIYRLQQFCKFEKKYFLIGFGHFQQIIELLSFSTRGAFLQNFKDFPYTLMECIGIISIRYLFLSLASSYTQYFGFSKDVVLKMLQNINESNKSHMMFLFSKLSKGKTTYFAFDHSKVIYSLFELAISPSQSEFVIVQALQIIEYVKRNTIIKDKVDIILKYFEPKIDFDNLPINFSTSIMLKLFNNKFIPSLILLMINNPTHMFLHEGIMASIESASDEVLIDFVEKNNVSTKLMWAMNVAKSNGFLTKLAIILNEKRNLSPCLQTPEWDNFVSNVLNKRLLILSGQFPSQFYTDEINQQNNSTRMKSPKKANKTQQQTNDKSKTRNDDEKSENVKKDTKKKKEKSKGDEQKESSLIKAGKEKAQSDIENRSKSKNKNKNKSEEIYSSKENAERIANNIDSFHEVSTKEELKNDTNTQNEENRNKNEMKAQQNNNFTEVANENKTEAAIETDDRDDDNINNNNQIPKILDSVLIKNLILQRMTNSKNNQFNQTDDIFNVDKNENSNSDQHSISSDNEEMKSEDENENNKKEKKGSEYSSTSDSVKGEIKSPSTKKNLKLIIDDKIDSPKSHGRKSKNEHTVKTPTKQSHMAFSNESSTLSNDHCRIALIKRKLYRNNEQSPQPKSPKDEKSRVRSFSVNWSPSSPQPNTNSKSEDYNENKNENKVRMRRNRNRIKNCSDLDELDLEENSHSEIKKFDFSNDDETDQDYERRRFKKDRKINKNKKVIDIGDDFSSSSDDDEINNYYYNNTDMIGPSSNHYIYTIFGPAYLSADRINEFNSSSDSSDGEFEFKFNPSPKRFMRKSSFKYRGTFNTTHDEMFGYS